MPLAIKDLIAQLGFIDGTSRQVRFRKIFSVSKQLARFGAKTVGFQEVGLFGHEAIDDTHLFHTLEHAQAGFALCQEGFGLSSVAFPLGQIGDIGLVGFDGFFVSVQGVIILAQVELSAWDAFLDGGFEVFQAFFGLVGLQAAYAVPQVVVPVSGLRLDEALEGRLGLFIFSFSIQGSCLRQGLCGKTSSHEGKQ